MTIHQTMLQTIELGTEPADIFYCLIDKTVRPEGMNLESLRLTDPRNIDQQFRENGCLLMFTGDEISSLIARGDLNPENLHESLFSLAQKEGVI